MTEPSIDRAAVCRLTRSVHKLIEAVQHENSMIWQLARQASIDLSVVEHHLGDYCEDVPECEPGLEDTKPGEQS